MSTQAQRGMSAQFKQHDTADILGRSVKLAYNPQSETSVHYSLLDTSTLSEAVPSRRWDVARLVDRIRTKSMRMERGRNI